MSHDQMLEYIAYLEEALKEANRRADDNWGILESVACGEGLECPSCGKQRPCLCSDLGAKP